MKNWFLVILIACTAVASGFAQPQKGQWLLGGTLDAANQTFNSSTNPNESKLNQFGIEPKVGFFVARKWALGITAGFAQSGNKTSLEKSQSRSNSLALFARYYQPVRDKLSIFGELSGISYTTAASSKTAQDGTVENEFKSTALRTGLFIRPGITYFITPRIGIETGFGSLGYGYSASRSTMKRPDETTENKSKGFSGGFNLSYNFNMGVLFYVGK
jgi:hypothetical protein